MNLTTALRRASKRDKEVDRLAAMTLGDNPAMNDAIWDARLTKKYREEFERSEFGGCTCTDDGDDVTDGPYDTYEDGSEYDDGAVEDSEVAWYGNILGHERRRGDSW